MKAIIIEDEKPAAEKLRRAILKYDPEILVDALVGGVQKAIHWLKTNPAPDLIFMDIELSDGLSFSIFNECSISSPVIFTTAFDEYWQEAFECNSIDYLLKPIRQEKLHNAINKYKTLQKHFCANYSGLLQHVSQPNGYRKRWLIKKGAELITIKTETIAYCYAAHKMAFIVHENAQKYVTDKSLNELEADMDPGVFFRISRKYLVNIHHIRRIKTLAKSKLSLELNPAPDEAVIISQENAAAFKVWIGS